MSEPLRIAAAVEGPTDAIVLRAALDHCLKNKADFVFETLQPEGSVAFDSASGTGWGGVYRWALQSAEEGGGSVSGSTALSFHDLLIVQVDADVAGKTYASARIYDPPCQDLPCEQPCPPPNQTTNALRTVMLRWLGEARCPSQVVLCTPSKSIEAWVVAAVWPTNRIIRRGNWECHQNPEGQLGALGVSVVAYRLRGNDEIGYSLAAEAFHDGVSVVAYRLRGNASRSLRSLPAPARTATAFGPDCV